MMNLRSFIRCESRIADFAEKACLLCEDGDISVNDICRVFVRDEDDFDLSEHEGSAEEESDDGMGESSDFSDFPDERRQRTREAAMRQRVWNAFYEARVRNEHCGEGFYPFELDERGAILRKRTVKGERQRRQARLYLFLLLATLETDNKSAALFERLCLLAAQNYWGGGPQVGTCHIGTQGAQFRDKINALAKDLGEGGKFDSSMGSGTHRKDGGMDIVVFRRFADKRAGQLIGFGQCKTGHSQHCLRATISRSGSTKKAFWSIQLACFSWLTGSPLQHGSTPRMTAAACCLTVAESWSTPGMWAEIC